MLIVLPILNMLNKIPNIALFFFSMTALSIFYTKGYNDVRHTFCLRAQPWYVHCQCFNKTNKNSEGIFEQIFNQQ